MDTHKNISEKYYSRNNSLESDHFDVNSEDNITSQYMMENHISNSTDSSNLRCRLSCNVNRLVNPAPSLFFFAPIIIICIFQMRPWGEMGSFGVF